LTNTKLLKVFTPANSNKTKNNQHGAKTKFFPDDENLYIIKYAHNTKIYLTQSFKRIKTSIKKQNKT